MEDGDCGTTDIAHGSVISHEDVHTKVSHSIAMGSNDNAYYNTTNDNVNVSNSAAPVVIQGSKESEKPKDFVILSCIVILVCNCVFGLVGRHYGLKSNYAWQLGDIYTAKKQGRRAMIFNIIGIILGLLTYTLALVLYLTVYKDHTPVLRQSIG